MQYLGLGAEVDPLPPAVLRGVEELLLQEQGAPGPAPLHLQQVLRVRCSGSVDGWVP